MEKMIRGVATDLPMLILLNACKIKNNGLPQVVEQPNIVLINIDDLGWRDLGFMGSDYFEINNDS